MKTISFFCMLLWISNLVLAQNQATYFKTNPSLENAPEWAIKMYAENPNVFEVERLYKTYYQTHDFKKTEFTQNYKFWIRSITPFVNENGFIISKTKSDVTQYKNAISNFRNNNQRSSANWISVGPFGDFKDGTYTFNSSTSNVYCAAASATNPNILIAGVEGGAVFKSIDKGISWFELTYKMPVLSISATAIDPQDEDFLYFSSRNSVYKSIDGGVSFSQIFDESLNITEIKIHPTNSAIIYIATTKGLYKSVNGGVNWTVQFQNSNCFDLDFHVLNPDIQFTVVQDANQKMDYLYKSTDGGLNWVKKTNGWYLPTDPNRSSSGSKIGVTAADPNKIYVALIGQSKPTDNGWIGVYRSDDNGETWQNPVGQDGAPYGAENGNTPWNVAAYSAAGYHQGFYNFDLEVSNSNANLIWVGTIRLSESNDGGQTFKSIGASATTRLNNVHADIQNIVVNGNDVWVATDGGINYSSNNLQTAEVRQYGISGSNFWGFGQGWNEDIMVGGRYHNGNAGMFASYGKGNSIYLGGAESPTGYSNPFYTREVYFSDISDKILPDLLGGGSENITNLAIYPNQSYSVSSSSNLVFDLEYANIIYLGNESSFYKSTNKGESFHPLHDFRNGLVLEIEQSRANPSTFYLLFRNYNNSTYNRTELYKSSDKGETWNNIDLTSIPANKSLIELSLNPENENEVWLGLSNGDNSNKIFSTIDGGNSWNNKTTVELNNFSVRDILYHAAKPNDLVYVAMDNAVFEYDVNTSTWTSFTDNLPYRFSSPILRPFYKKNKLKMALRAYGIWETDLTNTSTLNAQATVQIDVVFCPIDTFVFDSYSITPHDGTIWEWSITPTPSYINNTNNRQIKIVFGQEGEFSAQLKIQTSDGQTDSSIVLVEVVDDCNRLSFDDDKDGITNEFEFGDDFENPLNSDNDNIPDYLDLDSDNDGILDEDEAQLANNVPLDSDGDGDYNYRDIDSDNDKLPDAYEVKSEYINFTNSDSDNTPDHLDIDSDNDGILDALESNACQYPIFETSYVAIGDEVIIADFLSNTSGNYYIDLKFYTHCYVKYGSLIATINLDVNTINVHHYNHFGRDGIHPINNNGSSFISSGISNLASIGLELRNDTLYFKSLSNACGGAYNKVYSGCWSAFDVDNDGQENHLDLNSDNDACRDAVEVGHLDIDFNGEADGNGFNSNGSVAGITYNGTHADVLTPNITIGTTCNDNDSCTINDVYTENCLCEGTFLDSDLDGVCDAEDQCQGEDDAMIGRPCNDGNPLTINDTIGADCACVGTVITGVKADLLEQKWSIYPNPFNQSFVIDLSKLEGLNSSTSYIAITNVTGQLVWNKKLSSTVGNKINVNATNLTSGAYLIYLITEDSNTYQEIIKVE